MLKVTKVWPHKYASGKLLGFADVQFSLDDSDASHMTWKGFKVFQGKDGSIQIGLPARKDEKGETDEKGKVKYHPVIAVEAKEPGSPGALFLEELRLAVEIEYMKSDSEKKSDKKSSGPSATTPSGDINDDLPF